MKSKIVLAAAFALLLALPVFAQSAPPCVRGTLASYIKLGAGGCMFGSALYDNFSYATPTAGGVTAKRIIVTPVTVPSSAVQFPGLNFSAPWSVAAGGTEQSVIGYRVVPFPPARPAPTALLTLDLGQSRVLGTIGSVTVQETASAGTLSASLEVYDKCVEVCSVKQQDQITLAPISTLQVSVNVSLLGGTNGASLKNFAADVNLCPECAQ